MSELAITVGVVPVYRVGPALAWSSGLQIDCDGGRHCYAPRGSSLAADDALANAGHPGDWWGIVTDTSKPDGEPILQGPTPTDDSIQHDPHRPGYYVSCTALVDPRFPRTDPCRYVDANAIPYISVPPEIEHEFGVKPGDVALVSFNGRQSACVVGDVGPRKRLGEGSPALHRALGLSGAHNAGVERGVSTLLWPGSRLSPPWPRALDDIAAQVSGLVDQIGGAARALEALEQPGGA